MQLQDVLDVMAKVSMVREIAGATAKFQQEYRRQLDILRDFICAEKRIRIEDIERLPASTTLKSKKVYSAFEDLKSWLTTQHETFRF